MQIISESELNLQNVIDALEAGQTLVYPTETCYGLGCDATDAEAVERVYAIKCRAKEKSLILLVESLEMMKPYIVVTPALEALAKKYWPGPLTVIVPTVVTPPSPDFDRGTPPLRKGRTEDTVPSLRRRGSRPRQSGGGRGGLVGRTVSLQLPSGVVAADGTIAFRVTSHSLAQKIVHALGRPLVSTSANIAGGPNSYSVDDVLAAFEKTPERPDIIIDAGTLPHRAPSTVVRLIGERVEVVRQGDVVIDDI